MQHPQLRDMDLLDQRACTKHRQLFEFVTRFRQTVIVSLTSELKLGMSSPSRRDEE